MNAATIFLNDKAGSLRVTPGVDQIRQMAADLGIQADVVSTDSAEDMTQNLRRLVAARAERVIVAGGDGTIAAAVQELAHTDTALGIIPQGSANNFATALRLPMDLPSALRVIRDGTVRAIDLGKVGDRYFTEAAGVGLFADSLALYGKGSNKNVFRALYTMIKLVLSLEAQRLVITADGERKIERAVMCTVSNSFRMAYAMPVAPEAKLTDGELDVVIIGDLRRSELIPYYRAIRAQLHQTLEKVTTFRAREIRIASRRGMNVHCDDTVVGTTPATFTSHPHALKVVVDKL